MPCFTASLGLPMCTLLPLHENLAGVDRVCTENRARHFGAPRPNQSAEAQNLALLQLEIDILDDIAPVEVLDFQHHFFAGLLGDFGRGFEDRAAHHHADDLIDRGILRLNGVDVLPVAHHRNPIGDLLQLFQPVRDVHHAHTLGAQVANDAEEFVDFRVGQGRRRLVHDQHFGS